MFRPSKLDILWLYFGPPQAKNITAISTPILGPQIPNQMYFVCLIDDAEPQFQTRIYVTNLFPHGFQFFPK